MLRDSLTLLGMTFVKTPRSMRMRQDLLFQRIV